MKETLSKVYLKFKPRTWIIGLTAVAMIREAIFVMYLMSYGSEIWPKWQQTVLMYMNIPLTVLLVFVVLVCLNHVEEEATK